LGYPLSAIRKALHKLTGISQPEMAKRIGCSRQSITLTINGDRQNRQTQQLIASVWKIPVELLFDDNGKEKND